jgi:hypothetical protein
MGIYIYIQEEVEVDTAMAHILTKGHSLGYSPCIFSHELYREPVNW